jgi:hypothetical protein
LLLLMLYGVADLLRAILFVPDPFGRLLRSSVRDAGSRAMTYDQQTNFLL